MGFSVQSAKESILEQNERTGLSFHNGSLTCGFYQPGGKKGPVGHEDAQFCL